jgi:hypothetical protein
MSNGSDTEGPREWIFTFCLGQRHENCFTRIVGTRESARAVMIRRYGWKWFMQYDSEDKAGVKERNLEEIE